MSKGSIKPQIPLIDFSSFISPNASPSDRLTVATELVSACHTAGFAYIKNHGLSPSLLKDTFEVAKQFYDLPQNKKMQIKIPEDSKSLHGYSWPGREKASKQNNESYEGKEDMEDVMALNECYIITNDDDPSTPNLWLPESTIPGFRTQSLAFYDSAWEIATEILRAVALGLDLEHEDDLVKLHSRNGNILSFRHYPPVDVAKAEELGIPRMAAHRDFSPSITMLFQDQCGGLEILKPGSEGEFIHVTPIEGTFVMNIGDVLMRWSNDYLLSTMHRVALPPCQDGKGMTQHRYSIPFFVHPKPDTVIQCFPSCFDEGNPSKYEPTSYLEYVHGSMKDIYDKDIK